MRRDYRKNIVSMLLLFVVGVVCVIFISVKSDKSCRVVLEDGYIYVIDYTGRLEELDGCSFVIPHNSEPYVWNTEGKWFAIKDTRGDIFKVGYDYKTVEGIGYFRAKNSLGLSMKGIETLEEYLEGLLRELEE